MTRALDLVLDGSRKSDKGLAARLQAQLERLHKLTF